MPLVPSRLIAVLACCALASRLQAAPPKAPYLDPSLSIEARIDDLLPRLTLDEKIAIVHANGMFRSGGVERLGIPYLWMDDGPQGVREEVGLNSWQPAGRTDDFATALPPGIAIAATWDPALARECGRVIGEEARMRGKDVMLGPAMNIMRTPLCGRNYDYYGEDPWLAGRIAVGYVQGVQAQQTIACVKHYALNNQEKDRGKVDVEVDERTLREIYLPAFEACVRDAGALAIMAAYNEVGGEYCSENNTLLNVILKGEWGFRGAVISDWGATHSTKGAVMNGLDLEMGTWGDPNKNYLADAFRDGVKAGTYPMPVLDDKVRRNLRLVFADGAVDGKRPGFLNTKDHLDVVRHATEGAMVLLKNDGGILPIDPARTRSIAVIGEDAVRTFAAGGNSAGVKAFVEVTALEGIVARAGASTNILYSQGYRQPTAVRGRQADVAGVRTSELSAASAEESKALADRAVAAAAECDIAVVIAGLSHQAHADDEGTDRYDLSLPAHQAELISRVAAANPRTVVVLIDGSPVEMGAWLGKVPGVLQAWYGGSEAGKALAAVLFGDASPSGKLPCTFPKALADTPTAPEGPRGYPGIDLVVHYDEGLLVGYRWYDAKKIEPLFPFGFGLSYTTFSYSNLRIASGKPGTVQVSCDIANTGARAGAEVVQLYVHDGHASVPRPEEELKAFTKVLLMPGETRTVTLSLDPRSFSYWSTARHAWQADAGSFGLRVGSSSRDIRLRGDYALAQELTPP
jgi:beta-glucosidase